ncbi:MAG: TlyA family RNA methyltransferase [Pyrinomonadaceae bacterium]|nr:TlyA family RNA methyltransferase [Acidobacteriota bacterium]MBK7933331.1 TlyA family RNA methyltransferase [Acidobacteriota bacterium]MBP7375290.1 TlyA family RNA methyltransferase [Pyrinomonadaceae bacterium]
MSKKERIDKLLVERGLADSRTKAQALVMAGIVLVNDRRVEKSSESFAIGEVIRIKGESAESKYVGRGGLKLEAALTAFEVDPTGFNCVDIGASTGGFTDCLLQHGAGRVTTIDVGTNQLVWSLRTDPRVDARENVNARSLQPDDFDTAFDLAVMDVSFISVTKIFASIVPLLTDNGRMIVLIKPQFEVGRGEVGKGGIVRESDKHERVVAEVNSFAESIGLTVKGIIDSPILGAEGNKEFLALYAR